MEASPSLRELFDQAVLLDPDQRAAFLAEYCHDPALRASVERLLVADAAEDDALFSGGAEAAACAIGEADVAQTLPPGSRIGPFELLAVLGEGGSSTVFHAYREVEGVRQEAALKLLRRGLYSPDAQKQFRRERQALSQLQHAGIARLIEGGVTDSGLAYIALELVEGKTLTDYSRERRLDLRQRLVLFQQICRAVEAAHRALIVHRDLKPSNVLVTDDGQVKLLDFGIAKLLDTDEEMQTHLPAFTPAYAAPEQRSGAPITTATDVYALGILLGELITGQRLTGNSGQTPSSQVEEGTDPGVLPAPPHVTRRFLRGDLDNIVLKAINAEPERRYVSAGALADDIDRLIDGRPVMAHPPSAWYRAQKFVARHRGAVATTGIFLLSILAALGLAFWQAGVARQQARNAEREATRANASKDFLIRVFRASDPRIAQDKPRGQITAKELLDLNAPKIAQEFASDPDTEIELLGVASSIYAELDDKTRYQTLRQQQTDLVRSLYGDLHPVLIDALLSDTNDAAETNDFAKAAALIEQADALIRKAGLERSPQRARWWLYRAEIYAADSSAKAKRTEALQHAVDLYAAVAPDDPNYAMALFQRGNNLVNKDPAQAEPFLERAAVAVEKSRFRNDAQLHYIYGGLAMARQYQGNNPGAEAAFERALEIARETYGDSAGTTWSTTADYGMLLHREGKRERADTLFEHLLKTIPADLKISDYGDYAREQYAACMAAEGRALVAVGLLESVQKSYLARPGTEFELRRMRRYLGDAYDGAGRPNEARAILKAALDERIAKDPADYMPLLTIRERWGRFLLTQDDAAGAEEQFREVLSQAHERKLEPIARAYGGIARLALARGDIASAANVSRNAIDIFEHVTGLHDVRGGPYLWLIHADALLASGDNQGAQEWARRALEASRLYDDPSAASIRQAEATLRAVQAKP